MRFRFTTPLGITAVLTKTEELYELDVDLPDQLTQEQHEELEQLLRFGLAFAGAAEDPKTDLTQLLKARTRES